MSAMTYVSASAPGKLMLFGDHAVVHGHPCIVTAVDQRITATVRKNGEDVFYLTAPDLGLTAYSKTLADLGKKELPKGVRFIEMLYKRFLEKYPQQEGIVVTTQSEFSSLFGFGSSSAVTVAFAKALVTLYELSLSNKELFDLCYQSVIDVQGVGSGFDIASAIWGRTLYYVAPAKVVETIELPQGILPLVVGYTGIKADTPTLVRMVQSHLQTEPEKITGYFKQIHAYTDQAKVEMKAGNWPAVGRLMSENQQLLSKLNVSGVKLDELILASLEHGAFGAKLSGAGGGDCMIALVDSARENAPQVEAALTEHGGKVMNVALDAEGVRLEHQGQV